MRLTKMEHACMLLERGTNRLYIDPGKFTTPLTEVSHVDGVVITHEHDDHWTPEQLARIAQRSPGVPVLTTAATADAIAAAPIPELGTVTVGVPGESYQLGAFKVVGFGGTHAEIHSSMPRVDNLGVVVNGEFAYAGDAYLAPPSSFDIKVLAVPAYGPWMRIADTMDFITQVRPRAVLSCHEMLLAKSGKDLANARIRAAVESYGGLYLQPNSYDAIELDDL